MLNEILISEMNDLGVTVADLARRLPQIPHSYQTVSRALGKTPMWERSVGLLVAPLGRQIAVIRVPEKGEPADPSPHLTLVQQVQKLINAGYKFPQDAADQSGLEWTPCGRWMLGEAEEIAKPLRNHCLMAQALGLKITIQKIKKTTK